MNKKLDILSVEFGINEASIGVMGGTLTFEINELPEGLNENTKQNYKLIETLTCADDDISALDADYKFQKIV
jgi:hypothetical protein